MWWRTPPPLASTPCGTGAGSSAPITTPSGAKSPVNISPASRRPRLPRHRLRHHRHRIHQRRRCVSLQDTGQHWLMQHGTRQAISACAQISADAFQAMHAPADAGCNLVIGSVCISYYCLSCYTLAARPSYLLRVCLGGRTSPLLPLPCNSMHRLVKGHLLICVAMAASIMLPSAPTRAHILTCCRCPCRDQQHLRDVRAIREVVLLAPRHQQQEHARVPEVLPEPRGGRGLVSRGPY